MKKIYFVLVAGLLALPPLAGCNGAPSSVQAGLGEEFLLPIGQEARITGEDLSISFEEVIEDSRCPANVICVWEGRASVLVELTYEGAAYRVVLNEPGLSGPAEDTFRDYTIAFQLEPYPIAGGPVAQGDYYLRMTVTRQEAALSSEVMAEIYAAVIRQLYLVDHTFGEPPNFPAVYIIYNTMDSVGDPDAPKTGSRVLPEYLRNLITGNLVDLPAQFIWIANRDEVTLGDDGRVPGSGAIVALGNIHPGEGGAVLVSASLYIASLAATGKTYILEEKDGRWQVTGDTGVQWIS